ncbi:hypothetical protein BDR22DRAFT_805850 [Usnea florida]
MDKKRKAKAIENTDGEDVKDPQWPPSKKSKTADSDPAQDAKPKPSAVDMSKLDALLSSYGVHPLQDTSLEEQDKPTPETVLSLLYLAMLSSARISHELAYTSLQCLIEAGYQDIETLKDSTWEERTQVLTRGGYTRYREKTATALGELADFIVKEYDSDLNNLLKKAESSPAKVRKLFQEIKGVGKVTTDIFFNAAQGIWPSLAPFVDPRSMETAERCGLGKDVNALWEAVGKDAVTMCELSSALTMVRLEKQEKRFQ